MKISVIGAGYVGLVTATCFAELGNNVMCVENDKKKLASLKSGKTPFFEPGLDEKIQRNTKYERLAFSDSLDQAIKTSEITFIAVGTPQKRNGEADLSAVYKASQEIIDIMKKHLHNKNNLPHILVTKSTVPVGTGRKIIQQIKENGLDSNHIEVASNPEFLREGSAIQDFFRPDRIVIGADSQEVLEKIESLYDPLYRLSSPVIKVSLETSELSKYASNAFLATKISFINEMANLCELLDADVLSIAKIMGLDGRIGKYFLHSGPGYGGSCFPKDTNALVHIAKQVGFDLKTVKATEAANTFQKQIPIKKLLKHFNNNIEGKTIGILGIAFKPNTDDIREAPSLTLIDYLIKNKCKIQAFDPEAMANAKELYGKKISFANDPYDAALNADALVLMTEWHMFRELDFNQLKHNMKTPFFLDMRNIHDPKIIRGFGFIYEGIGRK